MFNLKNDELNIPICVSLIFSEHIRAPFLVPSVKSRAEINTTDSSSFSLRPLSMIEVAILMIKKRSIEVRSVADSSGQEDAGENTQSTSCILTSLHFITQLYWSIRRCKEQ